MERLAAKVPNNGQETYDKCTVTRYASLRWRVACQARHQTDQHIRPRPPLAPPYQRGRAAPPPPSLRALLQFQLCTATAELSGEETGNELSQVEERAWAMVHLEGAVLVPNRKPSEYLARILDDVNLFKKITL